MSQKRSKRLEALAWSLSGDETPCPIPSAHDRLNEAHYFLHQMKHEYHQPDPFRHNLHAFIQAIESICDLLDRETQNETRFTEFRERVDTFFARDEMQKLKGVRNAAVHRESLVPDSHASVGWFKYGRPKLWVQTQINPLIPSLELLIRFRNNKALVNLLRMWESEEVGVVREWRLKSVADRELLSLCADRFSEVAAIIAEAHQCVKGRCPGGPCNVVVGDFQTMLESSYFPEVYKAWEGSPTEIIRPRHDELALLEGPFDSARILHRVPKGSIIHACVGSHPLWEEEYMTAIVFSIDGEDIRENTAVFMKRAEAFIEQIPDKAESQEAEE